MHKKKSSLNIKHVSSHSRDKCSERGYYKKIFFQAPNLNEGTNHSAKFCCNKHSEMKEEQRTEEKFKIDITSVKRRGDWICQLSLDLTGTLGLG